jgi:hypothetical protein
VQRAIIGVVLTRGPLWPTTGDGSIPSFAIIHKAQQKLALAGVEYPGCNLPNLIGQALEFVAVWHGLQPQWGRIRTPSEGAAMVKTEQIAQTV